MMAAPRGSCSARRVASSAACQRIASCVTSCASTSPQLGCSGRQLPNAPLFQSVPRRMKALSGKSLDRSAVLAIVKRRCREAGLPASICNHSFRATGITLHQENGGDIEVAAQLAGHADTRTTQLNNRSRRSITSAELDRIQL